MTRLIIDCKSVRGEAEVPSPCTGAEVHCAVGQAVGCTHFHSLRQACGAVVPNDDTQVSLGDACVIVPEEKLILWIFGEPGEPCRVLHVWADDMPHLLSLDEFFPNGAFLDNGEPADPECEWARGIHRLHAQPPGAGSWRGPCVCACNLLEAPAECPTAWHIL